MPRLRQPKNGKHYSKRAIKRWENGTAILPDGTKLPFKVRLAPELDRIRGGHMDYKARLGRRVLAFERDKFMGEWFAMNPDMLAALRAGMTVKMHDDFWEAV